MINAFNRARLILFIIIIAGGLVVSIFILTNIAQKASDPDYVSDQNPFNDQPSASEGKIKADMEKLKTSDTNSGYTTLPDIRINPLAG